MAKALKQPLSEIERRRDTAERLRGLLRRDPSRSFTDELIAERRAAARAETEADTATGSARS